MGDAPLWESDRDRTNQKDLSFDDFKGAVFLSTYKKKKPEPNLVILVVFLVTFRL